MTRPLSPHLLAKLTSEGLHRMPPRMSSAIPDEALELERIRWSMEREAARMEARARCVLPSNGAHLCAVRTGSGTTKEASLSASIPRTLPSSTEVA